jgi:hypothetical protein
MGNIAYLGLTALGLGQTMLGFAVVSTLKARRSWRAFSLRRYTYIRLHLS